MLRNRFSWAWLVACQPNWLAWSRTRARLGVPALVVHGREDPIPLASSVAVAEVLGAELLVLEGCGHVPYVERPEPLFAALERFLAPILPMAPEPSAPLTRARP